MVKVVKILIWRHLMKKNIFIISILLFSLILFSCMFTYPESPENLRFGMIGGNTYLVGTWDGISGIKDYEVYFEQINRKREGYTTIEDKTYLILKNSWLKSGDTCFVKGKGYPGGTIGKYTTVLPYYGECKYDYENNILSWTTFPEKTSYLVVITTDKSKISDSFEKNKSSNDGYNPASDNNYSCVIHNDNYYAIYVLYKNKYHRMTKWYTAQELNPILYPRLRLLSYETGSNMAFNLGWDNYKGATDYTVFIYNKADSNWIEVCNTAETNITIKPTDFIELNSANYFTDFTVRINLPSKEVFTNSIVIPLPTGVSTYYSKCTILDDNYDTNLVIMRTGEDTFKAYWNGGESYYLSSLANNKIWSWMKNGLYKSGQSIRTEEDQKSLKFFLHTKQNWDYAQMDRISNYVLVELK